MDKLKKYREKKNLTLEELAGLLGLPYNTLLAYYYGNRTPSLKRAVEISKRTEGEITPLDWGGDQ